MSSPDPTVIQIKRPPHTPVAQFMNDVSTWLDDHKIKPVCFRTALKGRFEVYFRSVEEAQLFSQDFVYSPAETGS